MAVNNYLNVEPLSLDIANEMVEKLTNTNSFDGVILEEELLNNIKYGFMVVTYLMTFMEGFLNTILNRCLEIDDENIFWKSMEDKIDTICVSYGVDKKVITDLPYYSTYKRIRRIRNDMIHYKRSHLGESTQLPRIKFGKSYADTVFTKKEMKKCISDHVLLAHGIATTLGLKICPGIPMITCDGRDELVNYVYDPKKTCLDPFRDFDNNQQSGTWTLSIPEYDDTYLNYSDGDLLALRDNDIKRCQSIEQTFAYNSSAINTECLDTYRFLNNDITAINKELARRLNISESRTKALLLAGSGDAKLFPMVRRPIGTVSVKLYRNYEVMCEPQCIATCTVPYADNTTLKDLFIQLGLGDQKFNIVTSDTLQYNYVDVPFFDDGDVIHWDLKYENITVGQYLDFYAYDNICVMPFDYHEVGIGAAIPEFFTELLDHANEFSRDNPFLCNILAGIIVNIFWSGAVKCVKAIKQFSDRGVNYQRGKKYLETYNVWDEDVLLKKWQVDSADHLEYLMFAFGYVKMNGKYKKFDETKKDNENHLQNETTSMDSNKVLNDEKQKNRE